MVIESFILMGFYMKCGENVNPEMLHAIAKTESGLNPYVIANVTDKTSHYFDSDKEAIYFAENLKRSGKKYSAGLMQIYSENFDKYQVDNSNIFNLCENISTGAKIFKSCYSDSKSKFNVNNNEHLQNAMSCYYSGNFTRGFKNDEGLTSSYVDRVTNNFSSLYEVPTLHEYEKSDFKKNDQNDQNLQISENLNNWDVFNDYEK